MRRLRLNPIVIALVLAVILFVVGGSCSPVSPLTGRR